MSIDELLQQQGTKPKTTISFRIETDLLTWVDDAAKRNSLDRSAVICQLLRVLKNSEESEA